MSNQNPFEWKITPGQMTTLPKGVEFVKPDAALAYAALAPLVAEIAAIWHHDPTAETELCNVIDAAKKIVDSFGSATQMVAIAIDDELSPNYRDETQ